jgi:hypothetical protein
MREGDADGIQQCTLENNANIYLLGTREHDELFLMEVARFDQLS